LTNVRGGLLNESAVLCFLEGAMSRRFFERSFGFVLATSALVACSGKSASPSDTTSDGGSDGAVSSQATLVKLVRNPWDASGINVAIAQILLTEQLGMQVEVSDIGEYDQWAPLANGDQHASLEVWPSGHVDDIAKYVDSGQVENGGQLGPVGKISWYIPTYLLTGNPALETWQAYRDPAVTDMFRTPETGSRGRFLSGDTSWTQYDADIIKNLKLNLQVVFAGSEFAELSELDDVYQKRGAVLLYLWVPHSALAKYDLTPVQLPPYSDACYAQVNTGGVDCDYPADHLFKIFWPGLKEANPRAYQFLKSFNYTTKDQIQLLGKVDNQKESVEQAAREWIAANTAIWQTWLPK
jgi:glycine betaine/proline transport system substrate-binding protein